MPSCSTCGAYTDEKGKWAPAAQLSQVCTERDKAVKSAAELGWAVGGLNAQIAKANDDKNNLFETLKRTRYLLDEVKALLRGALQGDGLNAVAGGSVERALELLNGEKPPADILAPWIEGPKP